jgi:hypothetical protein
MTRAPSCVLVRCDLSYRRCGEGGGWRSVMAGLGRTGRPWQAWTRPDRRVSNTERWPTFHPERWDERDKLCLIRGVPRGRTVFVGYDGTQVDDRAGDGLGNQTASEGGDCVKLF